ncbi:hypothetical protein Ct61P_12531 [Colletotrichum tofieldiae]|nr:hypothetical protein Ct61P_12531 [Colletotrichum tofieldiae]
MGKAAIRALWPVSCLQGFTALRDTRWEDFDYERLDEYMHLIAWLGNGDVRPGLNRAFYFEEVWAMHKVSS